MKFLSLAIDIATLGFVIYLVTFGDLRCAKIIDHYVCTFHL